MIVPAVTEVCLPQAAHSKVNGFPPCGQPLGPAHAGHRNPEGQRAATSQAAQASSSGNWRWNSTSEAGKSRIAGPSSESTVHVMFLPEAPALVTTHRRARSLRDKPFLPYVDTCKNLPIVNSGHGCRRSRV